MIDLDSPLWDSIPASCGSTGTLAAKLLRRVRDGDDSAYDELYHQICHQFSVGAVAYIAVPHLVRIARDAAPGRRVRPLSIVGTVVAARNAYPKGAAPLRDEWRPEYFAANQEALGLAAELLRQLGPEPPEAQEILATIAALHGLADLAMHLFLQGGVTELSCPECGEPIKFVEGAED